MMPPSGVESRAQYVGRHGGGYRSALLPLSSSSFFSFVALESERAEARASRPRKHLTCRCFFLDV
jgi:hypothetical protein